MKIRIETVDGKKKYWVNEVAYDSIKDIPAEYQQHFADKDGNGMPDQFDALMDSAKAMSDGKSGPIESIFNVLKSTNLFDESKSSSTSPSSSKIKDYSHEEEKSSILPTVLKIMGVGLVLLLIWAYPKLKEAYQNRDAFPTSEEVSPPDSVATEAPIVTDQFILSVEDPNSPPYRMLGVGKEKGAVTFSFQLPDGKIITSNDAAIEVAMPVEEGTNLLEQTFAMEVSSDGCTIPEEASTNVVSINGIDFTRAEYGDSGAGQRYSTIDYYTERDGKCFRFSMVLHSGIITDENPVKEFDLSKQLIPLESILWSIRFD